MIVIGIDPGVDGGLAALQPGSATWVPPVVIRMPTITVLVGKGKKRRLDGAAIKTFLYLFESETEERTVVLEKVHSMPRQGVASSFAFGETFGFLKGMCAMADIPLELVTPQEWKKEILGGTNRDKGASILRAHQLFPSAATQIGKHDGMAEALLLAEYGRRRIGAGQMALEPHVPEPPFGQAQDPPRATRILSSG